MGRKNAATQVRLPSSTRERLNVLASRSGFTMSELIRRAVDLFLMESESRGEIIVPIATGSAAPYVINENVSSADLRAAARAAENREIDEAHRLIVEGATAEVLREEQRSRQNKKAARQA